MAIGFFLVLVLTLLLTFNLKRTEAKIESGEINVQGMTCEGCAYMVKLALEKEDGVLSAEVDPITGDTVIKFNSVRTSPEVVVANLNEKSMYVVSVKETESSSE